MTQLTINDPQGVWLGLGLLIVSVPAIVAGLIIMWKDRNKPHEPEQQDPPLPPRRRRPSDGGNQELHGAGPDAANNPGD